MLLTEEDAVFLQMLSRLLDDHSKRLGLSRLFATDKADDLAVVGLFCDVALCADDMLARQVHRDVKRISHVEV